nr:integrase, catalytic region, zinc finger, CCHC-type, peptidase aspartic, catalytic [Tanacetum cinerariifolium]
MHNNIMLAGSRDRPPMLATRRYAQWRSRFLRYIDTRPNGDALRKCILEVPYTPFTVVVPAVPATDNSLAIFEHTTSRFVTIVKQQHKLDEVSYHKLFDILKQYQKEVNELRAERISMNAKPLALVATAQPNQDPYYQTPKPHKPYAQTSKASIPTRSHATTRNKGKKKAKPNTPPSELDYEEDSDPEQAQRDKDMQKNLALIAKYFKKIYKPTNNNLKTSSNSRNKNVDTTLRYKNDNQSGQFRSHRTVNVAGAREYVGSPVVQQPGIQCFNYKEFGHFAKECRKTKRVKDSAYHKKKMLLCKQAEKELEAHYSYMAKIQEVPTADLGTDSEPLEQTDQNAKDERVVLANIIASLKLDVDKNKKIQKQLKKANTSLAHELEQCKSILAETSKTLEEFNSVRDSCLVALQTKQTEFEKYKACDDRTVDYDKLELKLNETLGLLAQKDIDIKEGLKLKAYEISVVKEKIKIVQLILFIVDSGCTKHKTGNLKLLCNFVEKYLGIVRFGNDQFAPIFGYGDLVQGNITINWVYYVEGLNHNLFSVGQFCDTNLEVAFWKSTCFVRDLQGNDLLIGNRGSDLYTIFL